MLTIISGTTQKPSSSALLRKFFQKHDELNGYLYIGYTSIKTVDGAYPIDSIFISPDKGLVIFYLIDGKDIKGYEDLQDDLANKIEAKLKGYRQLVNKRQLLVPINVITYAPMCKVKNEYDEDYVLCVTYDDLEKQLKKLKWENSSYYEQLVSVLKNIYTLRKEKRHTTKVDSRAYKLKLLEGSIANLDSKQSRAVIETFDGVQRIYGIAGTGKTLVLALKAAYLHAQHPEWKIAVTFNTPSLKGKLRQLINTFYIEHSNKKVNFDNLQIMHAWGAVGNSESNGIYSTFCEANNIEYLNFKSAKMTFNSDDVFYDVCKKALLDANDANNPLYDVILVDEAQDFSPAFLSMCYKMLHEPKRLVYAYDELYNTRVKSHTSVEEIFGTYSDGTLKVKFKPNVNGQPIQDIILDTCYRNSRPTLVTAHALAFGIYRKSSNENTSGLVQMFSESSLWNEIGYNVVETSLEDGKHVVLERTNNSSPKFLEDHSDIDDLIVFKSFKTKEEQDQYVANNIQINLNEDELRLDDIIVINITPLTTRQNVANIRSKLYQKGIQSHTAGVDMYSDIFFDEDKSSITCTGIFRAKGCEAFMVYIVNADDCFYSPYNLAKIRNQLFTAITRSKAWVRVLGVGPKMDELIFEYQRVKEKKFTLDFIYPTKEQRHKINIDNCDMTKSE